MRALTCCCVCFLLQATHAAGAGPSPQSSTDMPPEGASLFDALFGRQTSMGRVHTVPYPFQKLLVALRDRLPVADEEQEPFATVLIPLGRSLHRRAAAPEFFRYPRVVVAVDSQTGERLPTRDRLFLAYQEKAEQIEVISYNEAAGRFEFQVVTGYAPGSVPAVGYARRDLCTSCHQNEGPVFPLPPWSETNSDQRVAERIRAHHPLQYHGVATDSGSTDAGIMDSSTNRANMLPTYERVWREGCESPGDRSASLGCRADAFHAMLRFRLGVWSEGMPNATERHATYRRVLDRNWQVRWPAGLPVPDADLPGRAPPLRSLTTDMQPRFDPLVLRPPQARWAAERSMDRVIEGLAEGFLLKADIERLDGALHRNHEEPDDARVEITGGCDVNQTSDSSDGARWFKIQCAQSARGGGLDLAAELVATETGRLRDGLSWLFVTDYENAIYADLSGSIESLPSGDKTARLSVFKRYDTIRARIWDDAVISGIEFEWEPDSNGMHGRFALTLVYDLDRMVDAIADMLHDAKEGTFDGFDYRAIRGVALMDALFDKLGIEYPAAPPSPQLTLSAVDRSGAARGGYERSENPPVRLFQRHCGTCHGSATRSPPGFLAGDREQVAANLRACADRIGFRLAMWRTPADARARSPMPPAAHLDAAAVDAEQWVNSEDYVALRSHADALAPGSGPLPSVDYAKLPPCLP